MHQFEKLKNNNLLNQHVRVQLIKFSNIHNKFVNRYELIKKKLKQKSKQLLRLNEK